MPAAQDKIINTLRERRQIEADLRHMLTVGSELEFQRQAQRIASRGAQVIPAIMGNLDRADTQLLAAMGAVTTFLDRHEVVMALRQAVLQSQRSDQGRIAAMTVLERFLGEPPDDELLASLRRPEEAALASLEEVLVQAERNSSILIEYVQGLDRQEPDVVLAMVRALRDLGDSRAVQPLRMMAQDVRQEITAKALQALGSLRLPEAPKALQTLIPTVAPALRPLAERSLRKLQFAGVRVSALPDPDPNWRALVSPPDGQGQQSVWFIQESRPTGEAQFLNVLLDDRAGAVRAVGHTRVPGRMLPPRRLLGHLHDIAWPDGSGAMLMLEASFDLGRRLVVEALRHNRETQIPVAGPLRLLSPWLWGVGGGDSLPSKALPELSAADDALASVSDRLLAHPAFATWTLSSDVTLQAAEELLHHPGWDQDVWVKRLAGESLAQVMAAQAFSQRLVAMSEWFLLAGEEVLSRLALVAAHEILGEPAQENPFVQALVRRDLDLALHSLQQTSGPKPGAQ
jgi:hypothetical protein